MLPLLRRVSAAVAAWRAVERPQTTWMTGVISHRVHRHYQLTVERRPTSRSSMHAAAAAAYIEFPVTTRGGCLISACRLVMRRNNRFRLDRLKRQARYCTTVYPHSTAVPLSPKCLLFYSYKKCNYDYDNIAINKCDQILVFSNHCYFLQPRAPLN